MLAGVTTKRSLATNTTVLMLNPVNGIGLLGQKEMELTNSMEESSRLTTTRELNTGQMSGVHLSGRIWQSIDREPYA